MKRQTPRPFKGIKPRARTEMPHEEGNSDKQSTPVPTHTLSHIHTLVHTRPSTLTLLLAFPPVCTLFSKPSPKAAERALTTKPLLPSGGLSSPCKHEVPPPPPPATPNTTHRSCLGLNPPNLLCRYRKCTECIITCSGSVKPVTLFRSFFHNWATVSETFGAFAGFQGSPRCKPEESGCLIKTQGEVNSFPQ